jgi:hypothetical protein
VDTVQVSISGTSDAALQFSTTTTGLVTIGRLPNAGATGGNTLIQGQDGATTGGNLSFQVGKGTTRDSDGSWNVQNGVGTVFLRSDPAETVVQTLKTSVPFHGDPSTTDPLRFGVGSVGIGGGGTFVLTASQAALQTIVFTGTVGAASVTVQLPDIADWTKVMDFSSAVMTSVTALVFRAGAGGGGKTFTVGATNRVLAQTYLIDYDGTTLRVTAAVNVTT